MKPLLLPLVLCCAACCETPSDGVLAVGTWGGKPDPLSLEMNADGTGRLELACAGGDSDGTITVTDGEVTGTFLFPGVELDTGATMDPVPVQLVGSVCSKRLEATATAEDEAIGGPWELVLILGHGRGLEVPCDPP